MNIDKAIFTVVVIASDSDCLKLIKQINKLAKVRKVENVTDKMCVERGLMLMKLNAKPEARTELAELAKIFRASIVDVSPTSLTMSTVGDPGKNRAFQQACLKFGILEVARTGKLALKREPVFSESRRRRVKLMEAMKEARAAVAGLRGGSGSEKPRHTSGSEKCDIASSTMKIVPEIGAENAAATPAPCAARGRTPSAE